MSHIVNECVDGLDTMVARLLGAPRWIQINAAFRDDEDAPGKALVAGRLEARITQLIDDGVLQDFHFVFKPPGIRLRFRGAAARLDDDVRTLCETLVTDRAVASYARGSYDREIYQFGGMSGFEVAQRFFTTESLAVLAYLRLHVRGEAGMGKHEFSLTLLDLFLRRLVDDEWELWDIWCRMDLARPNLRIAADDEARLGTVGRELIDLLRRRDEGLAWAPPAERAILFTYQEQLPTVAAALRDCHQSGKLFYPLREIVPFLVVLHFNRMCFTGASQRALAILMQTTLSPKASLPNRSAET